jgi:hypothetical protein
MKTHEGERMATLSKRRTSFKIYSTVYCFLVVWVLSPLTSAKLEWQEITACFHKLWAQVVTFCYSVGLKM